MILSSISLFIWCLDSDVESLWSNCMLIALFTIWVSTENSLLTTKRKKHLKKMWSTLEKTCYRLTYDKLIVLLTCPSWQLCHQQIHPPMCVLMSCLMHIDHLSFFGGLENIILLIESRQHFSWIHHPVMLQRFSHNS